MATYEPPIFDEGEGVWIYALCDSDMTPRYVGKSAHPEFRKHGHSTERGESPKSKWIAGLKAAGESPRLALLQEVSVLDWGRHERRWIARFRAMGFPLLNRDAGGGGSNTRFGTRLRAAARRVELAAEGMS